MDDEWDDEDWPDDDDTVETIPCPNCRADVYEEAERCPACGEYIVRDTSVLSGKPAWYVVGAVLGIIAVIIVLLRLL